MGWKEFFKPRKAVIILFLIQFALYLAYMIFAPKPRTYPALHGIFVLVHAPFFALFILAGSFLNTLDAEVWFLPVIYEYVFAALLVFLVERFRWKSAIILAIVALLAMFFIVATPFLDCPFSIQVLSFGKVLMQAFCVF
jgi:hypothetical protein